MSVALCTGSRGGGLIACREPAARRFTTSLYPDGPELRLCTRHDAEWYRLCIEAAGSLRPRALEEFEAAADTWRFAA